MAVEVRLQGTSTVGALEGTRTTRPPDRALSLQERLWLSNRKRRSQRIKEALAALAWTAGSLAMAGLAVVGVMGLR